MSQTICQKLLKSGVIYGMIRVPNKTDFFKTKVCILYKIQALLSYNFRFETRKVLFGDNRACVFGRTASVVRHFYLPGKISRRVSL